MESKHPTPEGTMQFSTAFWTWGTLTAGVTHSIFTHIEQGMDTVSIIAKKAGLSWRGTQALLDGLAGLGLIKVVNGKYVNSVEASHFLVEGRQSYMGGLAKVQSNSLMDWNKLPEVVKTGVPTND